MNNPFYKIFVGEEDITPFVTSFAYEDCTEEDDLLKISLQGVTNELLSTDTFKVGKEMRFQFGYIGGAVSILRLARISNTDYNYGKTTDITITALDLGQVLKKTQSQKVWQKVTTSQIAKEIAKAHGLGTKLIEATQTVYERLPQANRTDYDFLQYLAQMEADGSFRCYIKDDELVFNRLALEQEAQKQVFTLGENIISFKPSLKDSENSSASANTTVSSLDPLTKQLQIISVTNDNALDKTLIGKASNATTDSRNQTKPIVKYNGYNQPIKS